ncbi:anti-sigma factor [Marinobacter salinus]|uniref:Anti-sigma factor n=2 Tax=Marinobacter salinus TaxID=1874317 RepID=A0A1D9GMV5_9GAMM|nr:anti-sigma factor [Marinobacter salinus]
MSCREIRVSLVAYIHNELAEPQREQIAQHLRTCPSCMARFESEQTLNGCLHEKTEIPMPSADFQSRVLAAATGREAHARKGWSHTVMGGAVAAALAFGISLGAMFKGEELGGNATVVAESTETEGQATEGLVAPGGPVERSVRLAFRSGMPLENVTLTLQLPPNVELASLPGRQEVSWKVSLEAGENVLALPLKVLFPGSGELTARLDTGERQKTFRVMIPDDESVGREGPAS